MKVLDKTPSEIYDPQATALLEKLKAVPERNPAAAQRGKAAFLVQAQQLKINSSAAPAPVEKQSGWHKLFPHPNLLRLNPALLVGILVVLIVSSTTTVYAAQSSTPDHFLYPVKIASEDVRVYLAPNSQEAINMDLQFAARRFTEIGEMVEKHGSAPTSVSTRWMEHIHDLFEHSSQFNDAQFTQVLEQLHQEFSQQQQHIDSLLLEHPNDTALLQLHNEVQASLNLVDQGLNDPQAFRLTIENAEGKEIEHEMENEHPKEGPGEGEKTKPGASSQDQALDD